MKHDLSTIIQTYMDWRSISQSFECMNAKDGREEGKKKKGSNLIPFPLMQTEKFKM